MATDQKQVIQPNSDRGPKYAVSQVALYAAMQVAIVEDASFRYTCFANVGIDPYNAATHPIGKWQILREDLANDVVGSIKFPRTVDGKVCNALGFNIRADVGDEADITYLATLIYSYKDAP